MRDAGRVFS